MKKEEENIGISFNIIKEGVVFLILLGWGIFSIIALSRSLDKSINTEEFYTYWNFCLTIIFCLLLGLSKLDFTKNMQCFVYNILGLAVLNSNTQVFFFIVLILYENPYVLLFDTTLFGGRWYIGTVFVGSYIFHVFPYIILLYIIIFDMNGIFTAIEKGWNLFNNVSYKFMYLLFQVIMSVFLLLIYICIFNPKTIYGLSSSMGQLAGYFILIFIIGTILPFAITLLYIDYKKMNKKTIKRKRLKSKLYNH
jgi:hypothetical protein